MKMNLNVVVLYVILDINQIKSILNKINCWGGWGGNGFGNRGGEASQLASQLNTDANTSLLMQAINGNKEAISNLSNTLNCDFNSV